MEIMGLLFAIVGVCSIIAYSNYQSGGGQG